MARKSLSGVDINAPILLTGAAGSAGQVLTSGGTGVTPTWTNVSSGGGLSASSYVAQGRLTGDTSVTPNADLVIPFVDDFDPQNWWDATAKQFKPTVAGYYNITLQVWWTIAAVTNNQNNIQIRKSGSTVAISQIQTLSGQGYSQNATKLVYLNGSTDYVDFTAYTGNSSAQSLQWGGNSTGQGTFFSASLITSGANMTSNPLVLKADTGTTEGTDLYTFNGSASKTLNIIGNTTSGISITKASGQWTIGSNAVSANTASTLVIRDASGNFSANAISAVTFTSTQATGTAPFTVSSTTKVANLNADYLDGYNTAVTATNDAIVVRDSSAGITGAIITGTIGNFTTRVTSSGQLYVGANAYTQTGVTTNPVSVMMGSATNYTQVAMINTNSAGSSDFAAYSDNGTDTAGWVDMGFTGSAFSDTNYTITGKNDGYVFAQGIDTAGNGGNLVFATGAKGTNLTGDIIFGTGGFLSTNERMRLVAGTSLATSYFAVKSTKASTSNTTGALVVSGGIGATGAVTADSFVKSGGTGSNLLLDNGLTLATSTYAAYTESLTAPSSPAANSIWFKTDTAQTFAYYDSFWVEIGATSAGISDATTSQTGLVNTTAQSFAGNKTFTGSISSYNYDIAGKNAIINGNFDIWQRGTSITYSPSTLYGYTADRWYVSSNTGGITVAQETSIVPSGSSSSLKISASASTGVSQIIETANALRFAGETVTASALVASGGSIPLSISISYSTNVDDASTNQVAFTTLASGSATPTSGTFIPISVSASIPSGAKTVRVTISTTSTSGFSYYIGQVQLEVGSVVTPFSRAAGTIQAELAACQRYYYRMTPGGDYSVYCMALGYSSTNAFTGFQLPATLRKLPAYSFSGVSLYPTVTTFTGIDTYFSVTAGNPTGPLSLKFTGTGFVNGTTYVLRNNNNTSGYLAFDAEL